MILKYFHITIFVFSLLGGCNYENNESHDHHHSDLPKSQNENNASPSNSDPTISLKKSDKVMIHLNWEFKSLPQGLKMELYEPPSQRPYSLWETGSGKDESKLAFSKPISGDGKSIIMNPGSKKQFVLVMRNTTNAPVYFFAAPHRTYPEEASLGFKFKCLCINHAFNIPPGETWYRVVELKLSPGYLGNDLIVTHSIIGIDKDRVKDFQKMSQDDHEH